MEFEIVSDRAWISGCLTKAFLFFFFLFNVLVGNAQRPYAEGFIVTNSTDTLSGFIEVREMDVNPSDVKFKPTLDSEEKTYLVSEINYFSIKDIVSYQGFSTSISMNPLELKKVNGYQVPPPARETVFLKVLQQGKSVTLFSYRDRLKIRLYIMEKNGGEPQELVYRFVKVGANYKENFAFRDQLLFAAERSGALTSHLKAMIRKSLYSERSVLRIISQINGIKEEKVTIANKASTGLRMGAGLNVAKLSFYGKEEYAMNARSSSDMGYWFSIGYDLAKNPHVGAMVFRADLTLSTASLTTTTHDYTYSTDLDIRHSFKQHTAGIGVYALYNIYNGDRLKFFVSAGVRCNFSSYKTEYALTRTYGSYKEDFSNSDAEPRRIWSSIPLKAGVTILKKFEIGVTYNPTRVLSQGDFPYKYGINSLQGGVVYHL